MKKLETIYLDIDEQNIQDGIDAISLVKFPAIEENWVALNEHKVELKTIDEDKRIVIGLALIPEKDIYRRNGDYEYNIRFSKETVRKASELYLKKLKIHNSTLEHDKKTDGVYTIESWIVEDVKKDKSAIYNLNAVEGAWVVVQRIDNDEVWADVKSGLYQGYSIEGYFSEKAELNLQQDAEQELINKIKQIILKNEN